MATWQEDMAAMGYSPEKIASVERAMEKGRQEAREQAEIVEGLERVMNSILAQKSPEDLDLLCGSLGHSEGLLEKPDFPEPDKNQ